MKRCFPSIASLAFVLATSAPMAVWGQAQSSSDNSGQTADQTQADKDQHSALVTYLLRTVKLTGSIRERWEATDGPFSVTPANSYVLSQERLGVEYDPSSWVHFMFQAQDARALFYQITPSNAISNPFDLHQAWVSVGHAEGPGVFVQIGRQDMVIGSGHLLAATDAWWTNPARNFDVAHGTITTGYFKSELVAGSVILVDPNGPDEHKPGDHIYADYNSFAHLLPGASIEPYFFAHTSDNVKSKEGQLGDMDTLAVGGRVVGKLRGGIDYNFEPLHEFGSYSNDRLDAAGLLTGAGWTISSYGWKPRLSTDYEYASGDNGKKNGTRETFDNMYGYNQPMNSLTGQFGWKNLKDFRSGVEFYPFKKLKIKVDGREYWLANTEDGLYNALGNITVHNVKATSAHVGESVEMMAAAMLTKYTTFGFGVGTLFPGEYLKQSQKDQAFVYPYISLTQTF